MEYPRQELFIGKKSQELLRKSTVCIVGIGALGSVSAELLTRAGIGKLILIDRDIVEIINLQRQHLFDESDSSDSSSDSSNEAGDPGGPPGGGPDFGGGHAPFGGGSYDAAGDPIGGPGVPGGPSATGNPFGWAPGYFGGGLFGDMF